MFAKFKFKRRTDDIPVGIFLDLPVKVKVTHRAAAELYYQTFLDGYKTINLTKLKTPVSAFLNLQQYTRFCQMLIARLIEESDCFQSSLYLTHCNAGGRHHKAGAGAKGPIVINDDGRKVYFADMKDEKEDAMAIINYVLNSSYYAPLVHGMHVRDLTAYEMSYLLLVLGYGSAPLASFSIPLILNELFPMSAKFHVLYHGIFLVPEISGSETDGRLFASYFSPTTDLKTYIFRFPGSAITLSHTRQGADKIRVLKEDIVAYGKVQSKILTDVPTRTKLTVLVQELIEFGMAQTTSSDCMLVPDLLSSVELSTFEKALTDRAVKAFFLTTPTFLGAPPVTGTSLEQKMASVMQLIQGKGDIALPSLDEKFY